MSDRIKSILTSADGRAMPGLAEHLAYETELSATEAMQLLATAKADAGAGGTSSGRAADPWASSIEGLSSTAGNVTTGGLGLPAATGGVDSQALAKSAWGAAVKAANGDIDDNRKYWIG